MTDVNVDLTKFNLALLWQQTPPDVQQVLERLYAKYPNDVLAELSGGAAIDAGAAASLAEWIGDTSDPVFTRYPWPSATAALAWSPFHPDPNSTVELSWTETNMGTDLGPYTTSVELLLNGDIVRTLRVDYDGLAAGAAADRAVDVTLGDAGSYSVLITINESGSEPGGGDPTAQGFRFQFGSVFRVGGADEAPEAAGNAGGFNGFDAMSQLTESITALGQFRADDQLGPMSGQKLGAALYYLSYTVNGLPQWVMTQNLTDGAAQLYAAGDSMYASRSFDPTASENRLGDEEWLTQVRALADAMDGELHVLVVRLQGLGGETAAQRAASAIEQAFGVVLPLVPPIG